MINPSLLPWILIAGMFIVDIVLFLLPIMTIKGKYIIKNKKSKIAILVIAILLLISIITSAIIVGVKQHELISWIEESGREWHWVI